MTKRAFGDLEQSILNLLNGGGRMTVKDVQDKLGGKDKYTTIMTVMSRLAEKKLLSRERVGLRHEYWLPSNAQNSQSLLSRIKSRLFGMKTVEAVSYLIDEAKDMTREDLERIEKIIADAKKRKPS